MVPIREKVFPIRVAVEYFRTRETTFPGIETRLLAFIERRGRRGLLRLYRFAERRIAVRGLTRCGDLQVGIKPLIPEGFGEDGRRPFVTAPDGAEHGLCVYGRVVVASPVDLGLLPGETATMVPGHLWQFVTYEPESLPLE